MTVKHLGRRAPEHDRMATAVPVSRFITMPERPLVDAAPPLKWPMDYNDRAGDCVVAAMDHLLQAVCAQLGEPRVNWSEQEIVALYRTQNPDFEGWLDGGTWRDGGMVIQRFLDYLTARGDIIAFGRIDHDNEDALKAAIWLGLGVITGERLDEAQEDQDVWDYVPRSPHWGGHATVSVAYDPDRQGVVSWGRLYPVTDTFVEQQLEEAWFVLTHAHLQHPGFRHHFDLAGFAEAVAVVTGGTVTVPVDPAPNYPSVDPLDSFPFQALDDWAATPHIFRKATLASKSYRAWRAAQWVLLERDDDR